MPQHPGSFPRVLAKLLLAGLLLFLLLEASVRLHLFGWAGLVPARINSVHSLPNTGFTQPASDPELVFELAPKVDGYFKLVPFRTNSRGLRDREYALEKPEGTFRVAVVGASFALPAGVEIERAFHSLLEEELGAELAPTRVEFINFAVGAYAPPQVLAMLERRALDYDPDLILVTTTRLALAWLAASGPMRRDGPLPDFFGPRTYPFFQSFLWRFVELKLGTFDPRSEPGLTPQIGWLEGWVMALAGERSERPAPGRLPPSAGGRLPPSAGGGRPDVIGTLGEVRERTGIPIVVVNLEYDADEREADPALVARIGALGMHYLDTRRGFAGTRASDFWIYELDPHPNVAAHAIFARTVGDYLRDQSLLPR